MYPDLHVHSVLITHALQVYDFVFDKDRGKWVLWMDTIESKKIAPEAEYSTIIVSTVSVSLCRVLIYQRPHCFASACSCSSLISRCSAWVDVMRSVQCWYPPKLNSTYSTSICLFDL